MTAVLVALVAIVVVTILWSSTLYAFKKDLSDKYVCFWMSFIVTLLLLLAQVCVLLIMDHEAVQQRRHIKSLQDQNHSKIRIEISGDVDRLKDEVEFIIKQDTTKL